MKKKTLTAIQLIVLMLFHIFAGFGLYNIDQKFENNKEKDFPEIRKMITDKNADTVAISLGAIHVEWNILSAVAWYIIGDSNDDMYYLPVKYEIISDDNYKIIEKCQVFDSEFDDIVYTHCFDKDIIFINNKNCIGYEEIFNDGSIYTIKRRDNSHPCSGSVYDIDLCKFIFDVN